MYLPVVFLFAGFGLSLASECEERLGGLCYSDSCPGGFTYYTHNYCGFMQVCCYNHATGADTHTTHAPSHTSTGSCGVSSVNENHRIVGGSLATEDEYPWQVSLEYRGQHYCGGTIIDSHHILTAAHCFDDTSMSHWSVGMGSVNLNYAERHQHSIAHISVHTGYNKNSMHNDIALVRLNSAIQLQGTAMRTACLPHQGENIDNMICTVTGWGATRSHGSGQQYLHEVDLPVMTNSLCNYYLGSGAVTSKQVCAGYSAGGKDACQGDSGGPFVCKKDGVWKVMGIVSWGYGCAARHSPGVYTRVSEYLDWIQQHM